MRFASIALGIALALAPAAALACTPVTMTPEQRDAVEDRQLLNATVLYRGVIENYRDEDGSQTMRIRRTRTLWGADAPSRLELPSDHFSQCPRGNQRAAHLFGVELRDGLGVTVLGRPEDASRPWDLTILVDGASDTQRVLRRFRALRAQ
ncbi:MAG: hypothetical protein Q7J13_02675 [Brevundimonas sp.]|uniref:hypothetical protein n=1 Tax=Brevundimonas sp. TaxID=1871086 RepID=UPI00271BB7AB|nr:hypothetical protein [Brevundimonas sp.]MDO9586814.1 hypothetical protein [Brevundimonas sp.]